jgi:hypothetical protein
VIPTAVLPAVPRASATTTLSENAAERLKRTEHARRAARWPWAAGAAAVLVLGGVGATLMRSHPAAPPVEKPVEKTAAAPAPAKPSPPPAPAIVTVEVDDAPAGLTLTLDGEMSALPARLPAGDQVHELVFRAPGHRQRTMRIDGSQSRHVTLALEPIPAEDSAKPAPPARERRKRAPAATPRSNDLTEDARKL